MYTKIDEFRGEFGFLSNFYPCRILWDGVYYPTLENAFVAMKSLDQEVRLYISTLTAGQAKRYGRLIELRSDWEEVKVSIMKQLLEEKFSKHPFKSKLLATGNAVLVEGNTWGDTFWGVCNGVGKNWLGRLLMEVRGGLNEE